MLQSIEQLYGEKLGASDGEIGQVKDFYFDDQNWAVRYLVADTGTWLTSRQVLITPHAIGRFFEDGKVLPVNLTRKQIENSPAIEWHKPVSRQYEEEYYRHYGWPSYWQGDGLWGPERLSDFISASTNSAREKTLSEQSKERTSRCASAQHAGGERLSLTSQRCHRRPCL